MSRKGNCLDNAMMKNFFGHPKDEMFHHTRYTNADALIDLLNNYIT